MTNELIKVGITQGDPNGIGLELIIRTFADENIYKYCIPVVYASPKAFGFYKKLLNLEEPRYHLIADASEARPGRLNMIVSNDQAIEVQAGVASAASGKEALMALDKAIADAKSGAVHALVTAPLDKSTVAENLPGFSGHTGYLAEAFGVKDYAMILISEELKVALATEHVPLTELGNHLTEEKIYRKLKMLHHSLKEDFGFVKPRIAVLGLNPHAGDGGLLGKEEQTIIKPAIAKAFSTEKLTALIRRMVFLAADSLNSSMQCWLCITIRGLSRLKLLLFTMG
jgi:4-hydroxythreonine-4-phosphate dehydrogenase